MAGTNLRAFMLRLDFNKWFKHEASRCQHPASCRVPCPEKYNSPQVPSQALLAAIRESLSALWFQEQQNPVFVIRFAALLFNLLQVFLCLLNTKGLIRSFTLDFLLFLRITGRNGDRFFGDRCVSQDRATGVGGVRGRGQVLLPIS